MKTTLLLITILLFSISAHKHYSCVFDTLNQDLREQSRKAKPDQGTISSSQISRNLLTITRNAIRITTDTSSFNTISNGLNGAAKTTSTNLAFLLKSMTIALSFLQTRIKVYPMTLIYAPGTCVDYSTPSNDQLYGVSASDLHIYVIYITDKSETYGATGKSCKYYGGTTPSYPDATLQMGRPTMGRIKYNTYTIIDQENSHTNRLFQSITSTTLHELFHVMGFDSTLFGSWLDSVQSNPTYGNVYTTPTISGNATTIHTSRPATTLLATPNVLKWAQNFFACPGLVGMPLQNEDGSGLGAGSHWQRVAMYDQLMTATSFGATKGLSQLTFAAFKDMGWYTIDDSFYETSNYGYHKGCSFVTDACMGTSFTQFCDVVSQASQSKCQSTFFGKAVCSNTAALMADGCGLYGSYFNCVDPASTNDGYQSYSLEVYSTSSFCVISTLGLVALPSSVQSRCYPYTCGTSSISFKIGTYTITCTTAEGIAGTLKTLSAFTGYLKCPLFADFCTQSRKTCSNWCSKNGYCMGGICNCLSGYYGADCSKTFCTTGKYYDSTTSTCVSVCPSGYYQNTYNRACEKCDASCQQCYGNPTTCTGCISTASNPQYFYGGTCYSTCPTGTYANGFNCSACSSADNCASCSLAANNCTSCSGGLYLSQPVFGVCQASCPTVGAYSTTDVVNKVCVSSCDNNLVLVLESGINKCDFCTNSTYKLISTSSCIVNCPDYFYQDNTLWLCAQCDSSCKTCSGPYAQNCTSCSPTATLRYLLLQMCWSVCPGGYYSNDTSSTCNICPTTLNCGNCSYSNITASVLCTSCSYGYYYQSSTQACSSSCSPGQYANKGNNSCLTCQSICSTCAGPGSAYCTSCNSSLLYMYNVTGGYCVSACNPIGYTQSGSNCLPCDSSCYTCIGVADNQCSSCLNETYLSSGYCRYVCPPASFPNTDTNECNLCDGSCTFCFGPTIDNCTGCIDGMVLYNFTCTLSCPSGYTVNQWNVCWEGYMLVVIVLLILLL